VGQPASKKGSPLQIHVPEGEAPGRFSNLAMVQHDAESFVLDFCFAQPGGKAAMLVSRVILSPGHAVRLSRALAENLRRYEGRFGSISAGETPAGRPPPGALN